MVNLRMLGQETLLSYNLTARGWLQGGWEGCWMICQIMLGSARLGLYLGFKLYNYTSIVSNRVYQTFKRIALNIVKTQHLLYLNATWVEARHTTHCQPGLPIPIHFTYLA